jgi:hypothetical protein
MKLADCIICIFLLVLGTNLRADEGAADRERGSYLPLIVGSTYEYDATFDNVATRRSVEVKSTVREGVEAFYFVDGDDGIIGTSIFTRGLCIRDREGVATVPCFFAREIQNVRLNNNAALVLAEPPVPGSVVEYRIPPLPEQGHRKRLRLTVAGFEHVTVPAGEFKDCLKVTVEELWSEGKHGKAVTYTGHVWLAKDVGVVKWIRTTGRVEVLTAYRLGDPAKKPAPAQPR